MQEEFPNEIDCYWRTDVITLLASLADKIAHVHRHRPKLVHAVRHCIDYYADEVRRTTLAYCDQSATPRIIVSLSEESPVFHYSHLISTIFISLASQKKFNSWGFPGVSCVGCFRIWANPTTAIRQGHPDAVAVASLCSILESVRNQAVRKRSDHLKSLSAPARRRLLEQEREYRKRRTRLWKCWPTTIQEQLYTELTKASRSRRGFMDPFLLAIEREMMGQFRQDMEVSQIYSVIKQTEKKLASYESPYESMAVVAECRECITGLDYWRMAHFRCDCAARKMLPNGPPRRLLGLRPRAIPSDVQRAVCSRDGSQCIVCGTSSSLDFDHIWPFDDGGPHSMENLRLLCRQCHHRRTRLTAHLKRRPLWATKIAEWVAFEQPAWRKLLSERAASTTHQK
jgi:hypothetical protein